MKTLKILNIQGDVVCKVRLDFHRWVLENGWLKVYDFSDILIFSHKMFNNEYSWEVE